MVVTARAYIACETHLLETNHLFPNSIMHWWGGYVFVFVGKNSKSYVTEGCTFFKNRTVIVGGTF